MARFLQFDKFFRCSSLIQNFRKNYHSISNESSLKGLVIGLYEKEARNDVKLTTSGEKLNEMLDGQLLDRIKMRNMTGRLGEIQLFTNLYPEHNAVAVVGSGKDGIGFNELEYIDQGMENARVAAAAGVRLLQKSGCSTITVDPMEYPEQAAEGSALALWRFQDYMLPENRKQLPKLECYDATESDVWSRGLLKAEAQNLARRLTETAANRMTPTLFADAASDILCPCGVNVDIRLADWIETHNLTAFLAVARSSCEQPIILDISYCGASAQERPIILIANGITYNSGGMCLRPKDTMAENRASMAGASVIVAAIRAAAALALPINIVGIIPMCENMPSGMAFSLGDVVTSQNGKTIAIHDTSNAGLLIMADAFCHAQDTYKPKMIIDVAALTDRHQISLGSSATAVFSNSHFIWQQMHKAGALTGDRVWRMPLWNYYSKLIKQHKDYDLSNNGRDKGKTCLSAAFLKEFVPCVDWCHLDIGGVGMLAKHDAVPYYMANSMTGRPTRTLIQFLIQMACSEEEERDLGIGK